MAEAGLGLESLVAMYWGRSPLPRKLGLDLGSCGWGSGEEEREDRASFELRESSCDGRAREDEAACSASASNGSAPCTERVGRAVDSTPRHPERVIGTHLSSVFLRGPPVVPVPSTRVGGTGASPACSRER